MASKPKPKPTDQIVWLDSTHYQDAQTKTVYTIDEKTGIVTYTDDNGTAHSGDPRTMGIPSPPSTPPPGSKTAPPVGTTSFVPPTGAPSPGTKNQPTTAQELAQSSVQVTPHDTTPTAASVPNSLTGPGAQPTNPQQLAQASVGTPGGVPAGQLSEFLNAIRHHESGGNYQEHGGIGGAAGATGAYQFMQGTWDGWAREMGRFDLVGTAPWEASPQDQDAVAGFMASQYYKKFNRWDYVAQAWYMPAWAGDPSKQNMVPAPGAGNRETIGDYGAQIVKMMGDPSVQQASSPSATYPGISAYIAANDPSFAWMLTVPELAGIINQAYQAQQSGTPWTSQQLQDAITNSTYYRTNGKSVRDWQTLNATDPASAGRLIQQSTADITALASSLGIQLTPGQISGLAVSQNMFGWDQTELQQHMLGESAMGGASAGVTQNAAASAKALFASYGIKLSDAQAAQYGLSAAMSGSTASTVENLRPQAIAQAKGLFPSLAPLLDQGVTVSQVFQPYAQQAQQMLGIDSSQIDLSDPKWNRFLSGDNKAGQMNLQQAASTIATDPQYHYDTSPNARSSAVQLTQQLAQMWGVGT